MSREHASPGRPSEESTERQLGVARDEGDAYAEALRAMNEESGVQSRRVGDYEIGVAVENAEGMWEPRDGGLEWRNPRDENAHIEVAVADARDGRFVPGLAVTVTVFDPEGREVGTGDLPFLWHPWLYHYGANWRLPGVGEYRIHVRIEAPTFARHDHENGNRYAEGAEAVFAVRIDPGRKTA